MNRKAVLVKKIPIRGAGRTYRIPERTLRRKFAKKNNVTEQKLATHMLKLQAAGFAPT